MVVVIPPVKVVVAIVIAALDISRSSMFDKDAAAIGTLDDDPPSAAQIVMHVDPSMSVMDIAHPASRAHAHRIAGLGEVFIASTRPRTIEDRAAWAPGSMVKTVTTGPSVELGSARASWSMIEGGCAVSVRSMVQGRAVDRVFPRIGRSVRPVCVAVHVAIRPAMRDSTIVGPESVIAWSVSCCATRNPAVIRAHPMAVHVASRSSARDSTIVGAHPVVARSVARLPMRAVRCHVARIRRIDVVATVIHLARTAS